MAERPASLEISEYAGECIREDQEFILYRSHANTAEMHSILLLTPASMRPRQESLKKLEHEYSLRRDVDSAWAVRPIALSQWNGREALVLEDPGGEFLHRLIGAPMETRQFLRIAVGLSSALGQLHKRSVIHKDLKPSNVLVDTATGHAWLTGFGIASRLPRERQSPGPPEFIAGTLPYMAPEQTGRMNRSIDSRSDLYALGVTLYEMLTGALPFIASDPMDWVHSHIARQPEPPDERLKSIPPMLSALVMKLLAKTAEERYQTATGLERDLRRCLDEWEKEHHIDEFPPGEQDIPDQLVIPEKLYGREREVDALLATFDRVVAGGRPQLVLVSGYSGVGKSSVVNELHKMLVPPRGLFAAGKLDQYKRDVPYATLAQAFLGLLRPVLNKSEAELSKWRDALREALDPNGQLIVDLVPELEFIIGEQPPVPEVQPHDEQARFQLLFRRFISVFARAEHPLALFLDDLQWLDAATLDLLEDLLTRTDVQHLLLIGAYRNNEVNPAHPLVRKLETIRLAGATVHEISISPLTPEDLLQLVSDSLHCEPKQAAPLAWLIHEKTAGNPFFAIQFISSLADEGLLAFNHDEGRWSWNPDQIHAKGYTDNVVVLVVGRLNRLPIETLGALQQLACLGNSTDLTLLRLVFGASGEEIHAKLWDAIRTGLIFYSGDAYRFVHDRVQEAAYSLIPEALRSEAHLRIGRLIVAHTPAETQEERIFDIVNQLNRASGLITAEKERERVAQLNLMAARRAKVPAAYGSALNYLTAGHTMLSEQAWNTSYDLIFQIERLSSECELLIANMPAAESRLSMLAERARTTHDIAAVTRLRLTLYTALDQSGRGLEVCLEYLRRDGIEWSLHPTSEEVRQEYDRAWAQLGNRQVEDLVDLPWINDSDVFDRVEVLTEAVTPAVFLDENLAALVICRMVNLSLEHGNSDGSGFAYVWFGIVAATRFGNYRDGFRFGRVGYELTERRGLKRYQARTYMSFGNLVMPYVKHAREGRDSVRRAFDAAYRMGDLTFAAYSCEQLITNFFVVGDRLHEVQTEAENGLAFARSTRFGLVIDLISAQLQLIRTLRGLTDNFGSFDDGEFDELRFEQHLANNPGLADPEFGYWALKAEARFFAGDYAAAVDATSKAQQLLWAAPSLFEPAGFRFYGALSHGAFWDSASSEEKPKHLETLTTLYRELQKLADQCPENFDDRASLVGAEIARIEGRDFEAMRLYERAIRSSHTNGFVHNEAIAYEIAARFYAARGFRQFADAYLLEARYCYLRWGADGKVSQLDYLHPRLKEERPTSGPASTIMAPVEFLDLATVIKVSQAVSGEIVLENLIDRLMRTAIEHAGAERGLLILPRGDELQIQAEATISGEDVTVHLRDASFTAVALPESIVRYVLRTRENVILDDGSSGNPFSNDPYIVQHRARSILCLPLMNQAKLTGVLYFENNLTPHVFTPGRITVLKVLASQAAISLENTRLYRDLENREARIRRLVDANIMGIVIWNFDGAIVGANEAFLHMVQYTREDVAAGHVRWRDMTPAEWHESDERALAKLRQTGIVEPYEKELRRKDGSRVPTLVAGALFEEGGNEGVAFALDLSEQKRAEAEIRELKEQLYRENLALRDEVARASMFEEIVGASPALQTVLARVANVGPTHSTVLITGETGTGKELIARAIHKHSSRSGRAFVSVNCAALAPSLILSELFGHERGAFTGAVQRRLGRFEMADGGTIFLDEVGDLPLETQVALLRVLQEKEFERVGGTASVHVDVRVIAATNRDLEAAIAKGTFRGDLFYRLSVFPIEVPPLRKRKDDLLMLMEYFVRQYARRVGKTIRSIDKKTLELFQSYDWPGNIRELQNVIERSVILTSGDVLSVDEFWLPKRSSPDSSQSQRSLMSEDEGSEERKLIEAALAQSRGRVYGPGGAAAKLGIPPSTLASKIKKLKISLSRFRFL